ncbi:hypothetical protein MP638_001125, partial [Amoeboaphelidium occidentale]
IKDGPVQEKQKDSDRRASAPPIPSASLLLPASPTITSSVSGADKKMQEMILEILDLNKTCLQQNKDFAKEIKRLNNELYEMKLNFDKLQTYKLVEDTTSEDDHETIKAFEAQDENNDSSNNINSFAPKIPEMLTLKSTKRTGMTMIFVKQSGNQPVSVTSLRVSLQKSVASLGAHMFHPDIYLFLLDRETIGMVLPTNYYRQELIDGLL